MPKVDLMLVPEKTKIIKDDKELELDKDFEDQSQDEEVKNKNKKRRKNKKKVQVQIEMANKMDQTGEININSPIKNSKNNSRKVSNENKINLNNQNSKNISANNNDYFPIPNERINHVEIFNKNLKEKPLLIIANKQDLPQAYSTEDIANILELYYNFKDIKWYIRGTSCNSGEGVNECLDWVIDNLNNKKIEISKCSSSKKLK